MNKRQTITALSLVLPFLALAVVYILALRADVMWLCAVLWVPIGLIAISYWVWMARETRLHRASRTRAENGQ